MLREDHDALEEKPPILEVISKKGQLLTLFAEEARELGLVSIVKDFDTYLASIDANSSMAEEIDMTLNQNILRFLGKNSWIFFILTLIGLNGLYMEIKAPGFGIPGLTALVCFALVFGSRYFLGTANGFEMMLFLTGLGLCVVEIFILPGFGVAGITGLVMLLGSLVLASFPDFGTPLPETDFQWQWIGDLAQTTMLSFLGSIAAATFLVPMVFKLPVSQHNMLATELSAEDGYVMATAPEEETVIGYGGVVQGGLRPTGKVLLDDGRFLDVVSEGMFIDDGTRIKVTRIDGNRIIVTTEAQV